MLYGASGATRKGKDALIKSSKYVYSQINWTMCKYANENIKSNLCMDGNGTHSFHFFALTGQLRGGKWHGEATYTTQV